MMATTTIMVMMMVVMKEKKGVSNPDMMTGEQPPFYQSPIRLLGQLSGSLFVSLHYEASAWTACVRVSESFLYNRQTSLSVNVCFIG